MDLSVVVVNWNSGPHLARLMTSIQPLRGELDQVWVVDNASSDFSPDGLGELAQVQILSLPQNQGFAGAANQGISRSRSSFVLLLNPDVEVVADSVRQLHHEIQSRPSAAIVCGSLWDQQGNSQAEFQIRPLPTWRRVLCDVLFVDEISALIRSGTTQGSSAGTAVDLSSEAEAGPPVRELVCQQPAAAAWVLRKEAWEELGGFDTQFYPAWFEDVDFCKRLADSHWQIFYFPRLPMIHQGGHTVERLGRASFVRIFYNNLLKYWKKHHRGSYPLLWLPIQFGMWMRRLMVWR